MSLLIFALIVLVIVGVVCWLVQRAPMFDAGIKWAVQAVAVIIGLAVIAQKAGVF